jgi:PAS domain S-box-containing protein
MELHYRDGRSVLITVNSAPILDAQEQIVAAVAVFQDISDRKQLEVELQRREQQFKTLADNAPDIIARFDRDYRHVYVSRAIEQATGLPASQYPGKTHWELGVPADLCQLWQDQMQTCFLSGEACRFDFEFMTVDGMRCYQTQMVPELATDGSVESLLGITRDVTDYKQVEQALRRSDELYRSLVASLPQLVCLADAQGRTYYCNQTWLNFTGLTLEQTVENGWQQSFHPDDLPIVFRRWVQALRQGKGYSLECRIRRSDGVYRWHLSRITPIRATGDQIIGWLGTATDIDERKQAEQTQRFLAQASRTFAAANLDLQILLDTITHLASEFTNDVCVLSLLSPDRQWLTHASVDHPDPEVRQFVGNLLETHPRRADEGIGGRVLHTGEPLLFSMATDEAAYRAVMKPEYQQYLDQFRMCSTLIVPLKVRGEAIGVLSLTRHHPAEPHQQQDITLFQDLADRAAMAIVNARLYQQAEQARHRAEQAADRNARLQLVTAALSESLTPAQVAAVIVEQSQAVLNATAAVVAVLRENHTELEIIHLVGYPASLTQGRQRFSINESVALADAVRTKMPIWEESLAARSERYPHLRQAYAQSGYAGWISLPLMVEGRAIGAISLSFTEFTSLSENDRSFMLALAQQCAQAIVRAQLYEAEQRARSVAEDANRMKDEFLAVLSHELRTPMNPILGWAKLLQTGRLTPDKMAVAVETIERNAKLQVQLIEDLLDISRILRGKLSLTSCPVDLAVTIQAALETVRLAAEAKAIQVHTYFQPDVGYVLGDSTRLQQVIWNLLTNAVKFTPVQGRIDISLGVVNDMVQIQIQDTGKGIQAEFLPFVFDTFRQADSSITRSFGGLGLGLAIVRYIVELHGGRVEAASLGEAQGSTFTVYLPLMNRLEKVNQDVMEASSSEVDSDSASELNTPLARFRILVVDDEVDNLELVQFILEQAGATVIPVTSATAALEQLSQIKPDLLVADIGMPGMDGYALLRHLRTWPTHQGGDTLAIALTAYTSASDRQKALDAGFQTHLAKPIDPSLLIETIIDLLNPQSIHRA